MLLVREWSNDNCVSWTKFCAAIFEIQDWMHLHLICISAKLFQYLENTVAIKTLVRRRNYLISAPFFLCFPYFGSDFWLRWKLLNNFLLLRKCFGAQVIILCRKMLHAKIDATIWQCFNVDNFVSGLPSRYTYASSVATPFCNCGLNCLTLTSWIISLS